MNSDLKQNFQRGECSCNQCKSACQRKPGWFTPEQIAPLANAMGLSTKELFDQYLQIDWWIEYPNDIFTLSPRLQHENGGTMFPGDPRGACFWYQGGKCAIHTLGKPAECADLGHDPKGKPTNLGHEHFAKAWDNPEAQQMIRDLYHGEPEASNDVPFDLFGGF